MARHKDKWTQENIDRLERLIEKRMSTKDIADIFGVSSARMYQVYQECGFDTPKRRRTQEKLTPKEYRMWKNLCAIRHRSPTEVEITLEDITPLPDVCPILGIPLDYSAKRGGYYSDNSPSIDRIIPSKGYIVGNCIVCSWRANRIKNDGTAEEHKKIYEYIQNYS